MNPEELALVKKAQKGDREALGLLWDIITPKLFGYLVNTLRDKSLAEDVLQTTWLKAIEALPEFKLQQIGISGWLFAIARNECRQHWRKAVEIPLDPLVHDQPAEVKNHADSNILVEQVLHLLPEGDRELLRLRYIADLPMNDIAKILNINFVTVRVRIHRAFAKLRTALASQKI